LLFVISIIIISDYYDDVLFAADLCCDPQELRRLGLDAHALEDLSQIGLHGHKTSLAEQQLIYAVNK